MPRRTRRRKSLPLGRGGQLRRVLSLVRQLSAADAWVSTAELAESYPGPARRTFYRDLRDIEAAGLGLERDGEGWVRLRRRALVAALR